MDLNNETLKRLTLHLDGSDGSMWPVRHNEDQWEWVLSAPEGDDVAKRRFVRVDDLLRLLKELPPPELHEVLARLP